MPFKWTGANHGEGNHAGCPSHIPTSNICAEKQCGQPWTILNDPNGFCSLYLLGHLVMDIRSPVCGWGFCLLCKICVGNSEFRSQAWEGYGAFGNWPTHGKESDRPNVDSVSSHCSQLFPISPNIHNPGLCLYQYNSPMSMQILKPQRVRRQQWICFYNLALSFIAALALYKFLFSD